MLMFSANDLNKLGLQAFEIRDSELETINSVIEEEKYRAWLLRELDEITSDNWMLACLHEKTHPNDLYFYQIDEWDKKTLLNYLLVKSIHCRNLNRVRDALQLGADSNSLIPCRGVKLAPLYVAAELDFVSAMRLLIKNGAEIDSRTRMGATPLINASEEGNIDAVKLLVECGADVNAMSDKGATPLGMAHLKKQHEVIEYLSAHGAKRMGNL